MIKNIVSGYGKIFNFFAKMLALLSSCALLGAAVVFPLWKFATVFPKAYTTAVLCAICAIFAFALFKKTKNVGAKRFLLSILKIAIILSGIVLCAVLVIFGKRIFAVLPILISLSVYGFVSSTISKSR